ncbi:MAG: RHS repeat-associated core domain-containing protein [Planctomycetota bacterium]
MKSCNSVDSRRDAGTPAQYLATRYAYDDNLTDGRGLDAAYVAQIALLGAGYFGPYADGIAVQTTNPAGDKILRVMDGLDRVVLAVDGNGNATVMSYEIAGSPAPVQQTSVTDAASHTNTQIPDGAGRARQTVDAEGQITNFGFDANGNLLFVRDPNGMGFDAAFDARDRETSRTDTQGDSTAREYDAEGNTTRVFDGLGKVTKFVYDSLNRKVTSIDRLGSWTVFTHDANGNLSNITDAEESVTRYSYDARNLLVMEMFPEGQYPDEPSRTRTYRYDAAGRLTIRVDQEGQATGYAFDMASRLLSRQYPDNLNDSFLYDKEGRITRARSNRYANTVVRGYDAGGRITLETLNIGGAYNPATGGVSGGTNYTVRYGYTPDNLQSHITYPDGKIATREYTARHELARLTHDGAEAARFVYDAGGRKIETLFGNGITEARAHRADNLPASISTPGVGDLGYAWDANKRKTSEQDVAFGFADAYGYDDEDRLTGFNRTTGEAQAWNLSLVGDWREFTDRGAAQTRTHNPVHELTSISGKALGYDRKGNLTADDSDPANSKIYAWDIENHLAQAQKNGAIAGIYAHDALGRRVSKTAGGVKTVFVSAGSQEIAEYEGKVLKRAYVFGAYIDEPIVMKPASGVFYYHANQQFSIVALTNAVGQVVERYKYDPYGKAAVLDSAGNPKADPAHSEFGNPWLFTGRRLDKEAGLYYFRARMYGENLGRFTSRDPIGYRDGCNLYQYVRGKPNQWRDPSGEMHCGDIDDATEKSFGYIICSKGCEIAVVINARNISNSYPGCAVAVALCTLDHESQHLSQVKIAYPDFCKKTGFWCPECNCPGKMLRMAYFGEDDYEIEATKKEITCLKKKLEITETDQEKNCINSVIRDEERYLKEIGK